MIPAGREGRSIQGVPQAQASGSPLGGQNECRRTGGLSWRPVAPEFLTPDSDRVVGAWRSR